MSAQKRLWRDNLAFSLPHQRNSPRAGAMAQGKFYRYKDPSLQCQEGILPHRYICQANTGSPPSAVCQGQGFRMDNLPWPLLFAVQVWKVVAARPAEGWYPWAGRAHSDCMVVAAVGIPAAAGWKRNLPPCDIESSEVVAPQRMRRGRKPREDQARMKISS